MENNKKVTILYVNNEENLKVEDFKVGDVIFCKSNNMIYIKDTETSLTKYADNIVSSASDDVYMDDIPYVRYENMWKPLTQFYDIELQPHPAKPVIVSPENNTENLSPVLQILGSKYQHNYGMAMLKKEIQVNSNQDFTGTMYYSKIEESISTEFYIGIKDNGDAYLPDNTEMYIRIRYYDVRGNTSIYWSDPIKIKTSVYNKDNEIITPTILSPVNFGFIPALHPILVITPPQVSRGSKIFDKTDWEISTDPEFKDEEKLIFKAHNTKNHTTITVSSKNNDISSNNNTEINFKEPDLSPYYIRGRHGANDGTYSDWSPVNTFNVMKVYDGVLGFRRIFNNNYNDWDSTIYNIDSDGNIVLVPNVYFGNHPLYEFKQQTASLLYWKSTYSSTNSTALNFDIHKFVSIPKCWFAYKVYIDKYDNLVIDEWLTSNEEDLETYKHLNWKVHPAFSLFEDELWISKNLATLFNLDNGNIGGPNVRVIGSNYYTAASSPKDVATTGQSEFNTYFIQSDEHSNTKVGNNYYGSPMFYNIYHRMLLNDLLLAEKRSFSYNNSIWHNIENFTKGRTYYPEILDGYTAHIELEDKLDKVYNEELGMDIETITKYSVLKNIEILAPDLETTVFVGTDGMEVPVTGEFQGGKDFRVVDIARGEHPDLGFDIALLMIPISFKQVTPSKIDDEFKDKKFCFGFPNRIVFSAYNRNGFKTNSLFNYNVGGLLPKTSPNNDSDSSSSYRMNPSDYYSYEGTTRMVLQRWNSQVKPKRKISLELQDRSEEIIDVDAGDKVICAFNCIAKSFWTFDDENPIPGTVKPIPLSDIILKCIHTESKKAYDVKKGEDVDETDDITDFILEFETGDDGVYEIEVTATIGIKKKITETVKSSIRVRVGYPKIYITPTPLEINTELNENGTSQAHIQFYFKTIYYKNDNTKKNPVNLAVAEGSHIYVDILKDGALYRPRMKRIEGVKRNGEDVYWVDMLTTQSGNYIIRIDASYIDYNETPLDIPFIIKLPYLVAQTTKSNTPQSKIINDKSYDIMSYTVTNLYYYSDKDDESTKIDLLSKDIYAQQKVKDNLKIKLEEFDFPSDWEYGGEYVNDMENPSYHYFKQNDNGNWTLNFQIATPSTDTIDRFTITIQYEYGSALYLYRNTYTTKATASKLGLDVSIAEVATLHTKDYYCYRININDVLYYPDKDNANKYISLFKNSVFTQEGLNEHFTKNNGENLTIKKDTNTFIEIPGLKSELIGNLTPGYQLPDPTKFMNRFYTIVKINNKVSTPHKFTVTAKYEGLTATYQGTINKESYVEPVEPGSIFDTPQIFDKPGTYNWTVPNGVTEVLVSVCCAGPIALGSVQVDVYKVFPENHYSVNWLPYGYNGVNVNPGTRMYDCTIDTEDNFTANMDHKYSYSNTSGIPYYTSPEMINTGNGGQFVMRPRMMRMTINSSESKYIIRKSITGLKAGQNIKIVVGSGKASEYFKNGDSKAKSKSSFGNVISLEPPTGYDNISIWDVLFRKNRLVFNGNRSAWFLDKNSFINHNGEIDVEVVFGLKSASTGRNTLYGLIPKYQYKYDTSPFIHKYFDKFNSSKYEGYNKDKAINLIKNLFRGERRNPCIGMPGPTLIDIEKCSAQTVFNRLYSRYDVFRYGVDWASKIGDPMGKRPIHIVAHWHDFGNVRKRVIRLANADGGKHNHDSCFITNVADMFDSNPKKEPPVSSGEFDELNAGNGCVIIELPTNYKKS